MVTVTAEPLSSVYWVVVLLTTQLKVALLPRVTLIVILPLAQVHANVKDFPPLPVTVWVVVLPSA